jgi:steroid delta-isomerase-like uncharacterized protein
VDRYGFHSEEEQTMSSTATLEAVRRMHEALNAHDWDALAKFYSDDCEVVTPLGEMRGGGAVVQLAQAYVQAFPDLKWTDQGQVSSEDSVVTEQVAAGTNQGPLNTPQGDVPPSGKPITTRLCEVVRLRDGEIVSLHLYWDNLGLMQEIGAIPSG